MSIKKYKPEQIVAVLRQIEVQMANGKMTRPIFVPTVVRVYIIAWGPETGFSSRKGLQAPGAGGL